MQRNGKCGVWWVVGGGVFFLSAKQKRSQVFRDISK